MEDISQQSTSSNSHVKLDSYRWVIVSIFAVYCAINFFQFLQFTIIANITERYYNVNSFSVDLSGAIFLTSFVLFFIPIGHFIERNKLKSTAIISTGFTALGNFLKLFAVSRDRFYLILIGQLLCGIGQVFMLIIPSKVANVWFGSEEVSTACAIGVIGCQIGLAVGALVPTLLVPDSTDIKEIGKGFESLFILDNIASITMFIIVCLFFRSKPQSPPSHSQAAIRAQEDVDKMHYMEAFKGLLQNKDYLLVLFCFGLTYGLWNSIGIMVNEIFLHFFPGEGSKLGLLILLTIISGGVGGTLIWAYILDKTHAFKELSLYVLIINSITWVLSVTALRSRSLVASYIFVPLNGFFTGSLMVLGFEYTIETTYPTPEAYGSSLLNAFICFVGIISVFIIESVFKTIGFLAGQIIIGVCYTLAAVAMLFMSSDLKRRDANLLGIPPDNYGAVYEKDSCQGK